MSARVYPRSKQRGPGIDLHWISRSQRWWLALRICRGISAGMFLLLISGSAIFAASDDRFARVWQAEDGLPDNVVTGLAQTPDGFLWVATAGGLARFDGARFQEFPLTNIVNVSNHTIPALQLDHRGRLWLGMDDGTVICVGAAESRVFTTKDGLPAVRPRVMIEDGEGSIWITYAGPGGVVRIKDDQVTNFDAGNALPAEGACRLGRDNAGQLWFDKGHDLGVFREGRFQTLLKLEEHAACLAPARDGGIWISTATRLLKYQAGGKLEERGTFPQDGTPGVGMLLEDRFGVVWVGTGVANGLFRYDGATFETVLTSNPQITCLMEDREGNLWVGTGGGGLNRLRPRVLELLNAERERPLQSVRSACEDTAGSLWMVTADGLLVRQTGAACVTVTSDDHWPGGRVACVTADRDGAVWIGTRYQGLYRFKDNKFTVWRKENGLANEAFRSLLVSSNGDVWIGAEAGFQPVLQRLRGNEFKNFAVPAGARVIRAMAEDRAGNIWVGTSGGCLLRIAGDTVINETANDQGHPHSIRCLCATADGSLWIGYAGFGLEHLKDGKQVHITAAQGLQDDYVSQIVEDEQGWLWFAGGHGFYRVALQQLADLVAGRVNHVHPVIFGRAEGLTSLQANFDNFPGAMRGRDGRPRIATRTGLAVIHVENIHDNPAPPPVLVDSMTVDGQTVGLYDSRSPLRETGKMEVVDLQNPAVTLHLPPNHRKIEFAFTALNFTAPENVEFRHRLEGFDEDWIESDAMRTVIYPRLPAGNYRFRVAACNISGVWSEPGAAVAFSVRPFVWQTWWFRITAVTLFTVSVIAIVRYVSFRRLRWQLQVLEQQAALDKERTRIARDLHDDLGGSLTQVALLLDSSRPDQADGVVPKCSSLVRQVVKSVDEIIWAINPRNDTLRYLIDYVSQFAVEFLHAAAIRCRVDLPDRLPEQVVSPEVRHNLFLVVKEALNNVACHARAGEVSLRVTSDGERLGIIIEDNGCGFENAPDNSRADGLRNMRQRMEEIGGRFTVESRPGAGTRVSFVYPWPRRK